MKKVWIITTLALAFCLTGGSAWAQKGELLPIFKAQEWQYSKLPIPILDTFAVYNGPVTATLRKCAIGTRFKGLLDDTIRVVATQSATPRRVRILTDTSTVSFGANKFRMDSCAYSLASGGTATALAIGDIDGDGYTDILTANTVSPFRLHWFEWDDLTRAFEARDSITVNAAINDIFIGDANNDGIANEILFNIAQTSPSSAIMRAIWTAPGVIDTTRILLTGTQATRGVAIGDVRSDLAGNEIYVAGGTNMWMVYWDGTAWTSAVLYTTLTACWDVAVGDVDPLLPGNEVAMVHGSTSYQISVINWDGTIWWGRLWNITGSATTDCDIAIGSIFNDNPGNEVLLTFGNTLAPRAFWISPVGGAWARALPMGTTHTNFGVAVGNVNKFSSLNSEWVMTGMGGRIVAGQQRENPTDLGTQAYHLASGAFAKQGVPDNIEVKIYNAGTDPVSNFSVDFRFKASTLTGSVAVAGPLASGDSMTVQVPMPAYNFTGFDTLYVYPTIAGDANPFNDTTKLHIEPNAAGDSAVVFWTFNTSSFPPSNATYNKIPAHRMINDWNSSIISGTFDWRRVTTSTFPTASPLEGAGMAQYPSYSASAGSMARLVTNRITLTSNSKVMLRFYMYHETGYSGSLDSIYVQYSTNGVDYTTVAGFQRYRATAGWQGYNVEIGDFLGGTNINIGFLAVSKYGNNMLIDSVRAFTTTPTAPTTDAGVTAITAPALVAPSQPFTVTATIRNFGLNPLTATQVYYTLGGADTVRETWSGYLTIGQTATHVFAQQLVLPDSGNYTIYAGTELVGDENPANDVTSRGVRAYGFYALPYVQDFNATTWLPLDCDTLRFASGSPVGGVWSRVTSGTFPTCSPYEGAAMAQFNSYNAQTGNQVMFISPRIRTGTANAVGLSFAFYGDPGYPTNGDSILIDITTDDGATWTRGVAGFWRYAPTAGWRLFNVNLGALGNDTIRVALRARSGFGNNMFVDQVSIYDAPPTITYTSPTNGATGVLVNAPVVIGFSEPIDQASFAFTCNPDPGNWNVVWNAGGDTVRLTHDNFVTATPHTFTVTVANDLAGNPLAGGTIPNPFTFTTHADGTPPTAAVVSPPWGASGVALNEPVIIAFSEQMNTGSVDGYITPSHDMTLSWNGTGDTLTLTPVNSYNYNTLYQVVITAGRDLAGYDLVGLPFTVARFTTTPNQGPVINVVQQPGDTYDGAGPFLVRAVITDPVKSVVSATLRYATGATWINVAGVPGAANTFDFSIPGPFTAGTLVSYYIIAVDDQGAITYSPANAPLDVYKFRILNPLPPTALTAQGLDMAVQLNWTPPAQVLNYATGAAYLFNLPANVIVSTRFTPMHYPCKLEQATSLWFNSTGMDSVIVHVFADDGTGMPDETAPLTTPFKIMPSAFPTATVVDLSTRNIVLTSGDFHIGYQIVTSGMPRPVSDNTPPAVIRSLYKWTDNNWYALYIGGTYNNFADWNHQAVVSYSSYAKGLALKSAELRKGQKPNYSLENSPNLKMEAIVGNTEVQYPNLTGALSMAKAISGYSVLRGTTSGGPYSPIGTATATTFMDNTAQNGTPYYYVVRANYTAPDTFSANSNQATATPSAKPILLVDDDRSQVGWPDRRGIYTAAVEAAGYAGQYTVYEVPGTTGANGPSAPWLNGRNFVIWWSGGNWTNSNTLTATDEANLAAYLNAGGRLFYCAQDYLWDRYPAAGNFTSTQFPYVYFGLAAADQDVIESAYNIAGVPGSLAEGLAYGVIEDPNVGTYADDLIKRPVAGTYYVLNVTSKAGEKTGVAYDNGTFRTVFFTTLFEDIQDGANTKAELMARILNWLATGVEGDPSTTLGVPTRFELAGNYPNPVRTSTTIRFGLPKESQVRVEVYNIAGQRVKTLVNGKLGAGYHQVDWNGRNETGQKVAAGVYLVRLVTPEYTGTRNLTVLR